MKPFIRWGRFGFLGLALVSLSLTSVGIDRLSAAPTLTVTSLGTNGGGNRMWRVDVTPDAALFTNTINGLGGSIAAEIGFNITGSTFLSAAKNATAWPFDNPGNNPFTGTVTNGVVTTANNVFAALGSTFFTSNTPVKLLDIVTQGSGPTTVTWGGQTLLPGSPHQYVGGRLAQGGQNFNSVTGSRSTSNPCDLNVDGRVDGADVGVLFNAWGPAAGNPADKDGSGTVDGADLAAIYNNWTGDATATVPEPTSLTGAALCAAILLTTGRRTR